MSSGIMITYPKAMALNFMGKAPAWYKNTILACLVLNPIIASISVTVAGWLLIAEFIFTLAMALESYPLMAGGLLVIEACVIGLCDMPDITHEIGSNLEVLLLLMFMVAGIRFIRDFLLFIFTKVLVKVRSRVMLAFLFCFLSGAISAFMDALTVLAIIISTGIGLYNLYVETVTGSKLATAVKDGALIPDAYKEDVDQFRAFLRSILMHAAVGTTLGGICTIVGEPQNLIVGNIAGWHFGDYLLRMSMVSVPVVVCGLLTCVLVEKFSLFGYGAEMPESVYKVLKEQDDKNSSALSRRDKLSLVIQGIVFCWLILALAFHLASVGLIGLSVIILAASLCGRTSEEELGQAFTESMPFCALLCVFFAVVCVISKNGLFDPIISWVLACPQEYHMPIFYLANGIISSVSDNVFVATIYIEQLRDAFIQGTISAEQFDELAIAVNAGTNLPSVATPNGQSAFLFLLTSSIAPLIRLPYFRMMWMALPYTIVLTLVGLLCVWFLVPDMTSTLIDAGLIHSAALPQ